MRGRDFRRSGLNDAAGYHAEISCRIAAALARLGNATDADFLIALGISLPKFYSWRQMYPEFARAVEAPPAVSVEAVERGLLQSALGFDYKTDKVIRTREGEFVRAITRHQPPDVDALEFALRGRLPKRYVTEAAAQPLARELQRCIERNPPAQRAATDETAGDEICRVAYVMSRLGASDSEIAAALAVSLEEFSNLRRQPKLSEALESGKKLVDQALERALAHCAGGYHYVEEDIFCSREGDIRRTRVSRYLTGDLKALELWMLAHPGGPEHLLDCCGVADSQ